MFSDETADIGNMNPRKILLPNKNQTKKKAHQCYFIWIRWVSVCFFFHAATIRGLQCAMTRIFFQSNEVQKSDCYDLLHSLQSKQSFFFKLNLHENEIYFHSFPIRMQYSIWHTFTIMFFFIGINIHLLLLHQHRKIANTKQRMFMRAQNMHRNNSCFNPIYY